jgi:hypothetical protein
MKKPLLPEHPFPEQVSPPGYLDLQLAYTMTSLDQLPLRSARSLGLSNESSVLKLKTG